MCLGHGVHAGVHLIDLGLIFLRIGPSMHPSNLPHLVPQRLQEFTREVLDGSKSDGNP